MESINNKLIELGFKIIKKCHLEDKYMANYVQNLTNNEIKKVKTEMYEDIKKLGIQLGNNTDIKKHMN